MLVGVSESSVLPHQPSDSLRDVVITYRFITVGQSALSAVARNARRNVRD
jgi:pyrroloquinoline quinone (PQQ) biosynthesis protein C